MNFIHTPQHVILSYGEEQIAKEILKVEDSINRIRFPNSDKTSTLSQQIMNSQNQSFSEFSKRRSHSLDMHTNQKLDALLNTILQIKYVLNQIINHLQYQILFRNLESEQLPQKEVTKYFRHGE